MIYKVLNTTAEEALNGTSVLHLAALQQGAKILRVHDVAPAKETIQLFLQLQKHIPKSELL
jgi:dihydropteroate synthase